VSSSSPGWKIGGKIIGLGNVLFLLPLLEGGLFFTAGNEGKRKGGFLLSFRKMVLLLYPSSIASLVEGVVFQLVGARNSIPIFERANLL